MHPYPKHKQGHYQEHKCKTGVLLLLCSWLVQCVCNGNINLIDSHGITPVHWRVDVRDTPHLGPERVRTWCMLLLHQIDSCVMVIWDTRFVFYDIDYCVLN